MRLFIIIFIITFNCLAQTPPVHDPNFLDDTPALENELPNQRSRRAVAQTQKALLAMPYIKTSKRNIEKHIRKHFNKELLATIGALYVAFNKKEVSTRHIKNFSTPIAGGNVRPDIGLQTESNNFYYGVSFIRVIP